MRIKKILNGFFGAIESNILANRATGRNTELAKLVGNNDRVVFSTHRDKKDFIAIMRKEGNVSATSLVIVDFRKLDSLLKNNRVKGTTYFDHYFIEQYFLGKLQSASESLEYIAKLNCDIPYEEIDEIKGNSSTYGKLKI